MKVVLTGLFLITCLTGFSQDSTVNKTDSLAHQEGFDFYVVQAGDLFLSVDTEENTTQMELLDPSWIESITLYKAADARLKYGEKATEGVIIIDLTKDGFKKLPKTLRDKFKRKPT
ncbi:MAG: hypothetical protein DI538_03695 [Azospira oryzae]|jgi:hypothetical protein|nr:hypothetical protein [Cytophaga sp.]PZR40646.1 MAG: hypothetical protein DI538_03695 [Azospira oryzae]